MNLPKLPGYSFYDPRKTDYRKPQMLTVTAGLMGQRPPRPEDLETSATLRSASITTRAPPQEPVSTFPDYIPAHVAYEHLVLRFYAYFRETVPESNDETFRVRYVRIHVYLEDDTIMIEENHERNSGISQGVLLRRMRVINPNAPADTFYQISDFNVGQSMDMFGTVYRIYACDKFTEEYFQSIGKQLNPFEDPPDDLYTVKRRITERPIRVSYINTDKTNLRRFLDFDGKVLRFYATWDDRESLFGEKRKFIVHFFLVDDTIEIVQVLPVNSGRDPVSRFLMKTKLKKPNSNEYYTDQDLDIGKVIDVFNRKFILYDADEFTKEFLDNKFGPHNWTPLTIEEAQNRFNTTTAQEELPPYNGWGDEEDSRGYCYSLHPKAPRKDIVKFITKDGMLLRFAAKLKNPQPQDANRKFVIVYYLSDDTVAVFELPERNSGFRGGKFIQRAKIKNTRAGGRYFTASDFQVGQDILINAFEFTTYDADEYAMNYMESMPEDFPQSDLFDITTQMRKTRSKVDQMRQSMEAYDKDLVGYIQPAVARKILMDTFGMTEHEAMTVTRRYSENAGFDYFSFMKAFT